jgi:hypothetical protein
MLGQGVEVSDHGFDGREPRSRGPVFGVWSVP